jgi:hypothetical protein
MAGSGFFPFFEMRLPPDPVKRQEPSTDVTIQYGLALVAKRPFCDVTLPFFRMRDSKASCVKTGKRFEAFRPLFSPVQQKAKTLPEKNRERTKRAFRHLDESLLNSYPPIVFRLWQTEKLDVCVW